MFHHVVQQARQLREAARKRELRGMNQTCKRVHRGGIADVAGRGVFENR